MLRGGCFERDVKLGKVRAKSVLGLLSERVSVDLV